MKLPCKLVTVVLIIFCLVLIGQTALAGEPVDSTRPPMPIQYQPLTDAGPEIVLPLSGWVTIGVTSSATSSTLDALGQEAPDSRIFTPNARDAVGSIWTVDSLERGTGLVFFLENRDPTTGPNQASIYPYISDGFPAWSLNFEDWSDGDWDDVICEVYLTPDTVIRVDTVWITDAVPIKGVTGPAWVGTYDEDGVLRGQQVRKVADAMTGNVRGASFFTADVHLRGFPGMPPSFDPKVFCEWSITPICASEPTLSGEGEFDQSYKLTLPTPQAIGQYDLQLCLEIRDNQNQPLSNQYMSTTLYVVYNQVDTASYLAYLSTNVLEKGTAWACGATDSLSLLDSLNNGIYSQSGWDYLDADRDPQWQGLLLLDDIADHGNCHDFCEAWRILGALFGVSAVEHITVRGTTYSLGFLTKPATALDGEIGNAGPCGGSIERWKFTEHGFGRYEPADPDYFDPTFGQRYQESTSFIEWSIIQQLDDATELDDGGHIVRRITQVDPLIATGERWCYESAEDKGTFSELDGETDSPTIVGISDEAKIDLTGNGYFNCLRLTVDVNIDQAGWYFVSGRLMSENGMTLVSNCSEVYASTASVGIAMICTTGDTTFPLQFSGQQIFESGQDGNYVVDVSICKQMDGTIIDQASIALSSYDHAEFRELPGEIIGVTEQPVDTDEDGLYNYLDVDISWNTIQADDFRGTCILKSGSTIIGTVTDTAILSQGSNTKTMRLDGTVIRESGLDGPYSLTVILDGGGLLLNDSKNFETASYLHSDFEGKPITFSGIFNDYGRDDDEDGQYDVLVIETELQSEEVGSYIVRGWLTDDEGQYTLTADASCDLVEGSNTVAVEFDGERIYAEQCDGPFELNMITVERDNGDYVNSRQNGYTTQEYSYTAFEKPPVYLTGFFDDYGGYPGTPPYWWLVIEVEVVSATDGYVSLHADLCDMYGRHVTRGAAFVNLTANTPTRIPIQFDGRRIWGGLQSGVFHLKNVTVTQADNPENQLTISGAYTTRYYSYTSFLQAAAARGTVTDASGTPIEGACLTMLPHDQDCTLSDGKYRLCAIEGGSYVIKMDYAPDVSSFWWQIFVDDELVEEGDSVIVDLVEGEIRKVDFKVGDGERGSIEGAVTDEIGGVSGVTVELCDELGQEIKESATSQSGSYLFGVVEPGDYTVRIVPPIGFTAVDQVLPATVEADDTTTVDFSLTRLNVQSQPEPADFWARQIKAHLTGRGKPLVSQEEFSEYMASINIHFNHNLINPVTIFEVQQGNADWLDSLRALNDLLAVKKMDPPAAVATQQLAALMLNFVSLKLHQMEVISVDGATASQAFTYCHELIVDFSDDNDTLAVAIGQAVNNGIPVGEGLIPLSTPNIAYKGSINAVGESLPKAFALSQNYPNPFNPLTEIKFALPVACDTKLEIFNIMGQRVTTLVNRPIEAGYHTVTWDGSKMASGVYLYRLRAGDFVESKKMILVK